MVPELSLQLRLKDGVRGEALVVLKDMRDAQTRIEALEFETSFLKASGSVGIMRDGIAMLSNELYRKQCMLHMILDSVEDELIEEVGSRSYIDGAKVGVGVGGEWEDLNPKDVVQRCCMMRPRESKYSCIEIAALSPSLKNE